MIDLASSRSRKPTIPPDSSLVKFRDENCPDISYDDPQLFYLLLEKIIELKGEKNG